MGSGHADESEGEEESEREEVCLVPCAFGARLSKG